VFTREIKALATKTKIKIPRKPLIHPHISTEQSPVSSFSTASVAPQRTTKEGMAAADAAKGKIILGPI
jgi:hypothetical protein